jgi:hypothetical protein
VDSGREWRGGQNQVRLTASGLLARGHSVVLACRRGGPLAARARSAGIDVREIPFGSELSPRPALALARLLRDVRPQIVQAHDPHSLTASLLAVAPGVPLLSSPHDGSTSLRVRSLRDSSTNWRRWSSQ